MIVKKVLFCSLLLFSSSLTLGKSVIDMTDSAQREYNLLIEIENKLLSKPIVKNSVQIKSEIKKLRFDISVHCSELFSDGSIAHFEQLSCLNAYNTSLLKILNDKFTFYPSECPLSVAPIKQEAVFNYTGISGEICQEKPDIVCKNNVIKRLNVDLNTHDNCLPNWLKKLKKEYLYIIKEKSYLFSKPSKKTKMYLIKGDKVTILDEETDESGQKWYFINYKGKKDLNMWIKAEAVNLEPEIKKEEPKSVTIKPEPVTEKPTIKTIETTEQAPTTQPPVKAEIVKTEKTEVLESSGGSVSFIVLASMMSLLTWRLSNRA